MRTPPSRKLVVFAIIASMTIFPGCKLLKKKPPPPTPSSQQLMLFSAGDRVDVRWNGGWWKAIILTVHAPFYRVHYIGWSTTWDEDVLSDRVRFLSSESREGTELAPPPPPVVVAKGWKAGDRVDVSWNGQWWAAQILYPSGAGYRVHYTGWSSSWDETVSASRVRAATPGARRGTN